MSVIEFCLGSGSSRAPMYPVRFLVLPTPLVRTTSERLWPTGRTVVATYKTISKLRPSSSILRFVAVSIILLFSLWRCSLPLDFAGSPSVFAQTCSGTCYNDYVVGNGSNYANAYFDVDYVRVFSKSGTNTASGASGLDLTWSLRALGALSAVVSWLVL